MTKSTPGAYTIYVCPERDIECGSNARSWCATCPKRAPGADVADERAAFDKWLRDRLFANPPRATQLFDAWQARAALAAPAADSTAEDKARIVELEVLVARYEARMLRMATCAGEFAKEACDATNRAALAAAAPIPAVIDRAAAHAMVHTGRPAADLIREAYAMGAAIGLEDAARVLDGAASRWMCAPDEARELAKEIRTMIAAPAPCPPPPHPAFARQMVVCETCGFKRCPHVNDPANVCTGSNVAGQVGSAHAKTDWSAA